MKIPPFVISVELEDGRVEAGEYVQSLVCQVDKFRDHSVILNRVSWKIATALGLVADTDEISELDSPEQVLNELDRLIASRDGLRTALQDAIDEWKAAAAQVIVDNYTTAVSQEQAFAELEAEIDKARPKP